MQKLFIIIINFILSAIELLLQAALLALKVAALCLIAKYMLYYFSMTVVPAWLYYLTASFAIVASSYILMQCGGMLDYNIHAGENWLLDMPVLGIVIGLAKDTAHIGITLYENLTTLTKESYYQKFKNVGLLLLKILAIAATSAVLACSVYLLQLYCLPYLTLIMPTIAPIVKLFAAYAITLVVSDFAYKTAIKLELQLKATALAMASMFAATAYYYNLIPAAHMIFMLGAFPALVCLCCLLIEVTIVSAKAWNQQYEKIVALEKKLENMEAQQQSAQSQHQDQIKNTQENHKKEIKKLDSKLESMFTSKQAAYKNDLTEKLEEIQKAYTQAIEQAIAKVAGESKQQLTEAMNPLQENLKQLDSKLQDERNKDKAAHENDLTEKLEEIQKAYTQAIEQAIAKVEEKSKQRLTKAMKPYQEELEQQEQNAAELENSPIILQNYLESMKTHINKRLKMIKEEFEEAIQILAEEEEKICQSSEHTESQTEMIKQYSDMTGLNDHSRKQYILQNWQSIATAPPIRRYFTHWKNYMQPADNVEEQKPTPKSLLNQPPGTPVPENVTLRGQTTPRQPLGERQNTHNSQQTPNNSKSVPTTAATPMLVTL